MLATQSLLLAISLWFLRQVFCDIARGLPFSTDQTARFLRWAFYFCSTRLLSLSPTISLIFILVWDQSR
jgi:hypothetical protein